MNNIVKELVQDYWSEQLSRVAIGELKSLCKKYKIEGVTPIIDGAVNTIVQIYVDKESKGEEVRTDE